MIDRDAAADAALAYALWDAEHTTKMDPMRSEEYVTRARVVRVWLRTNGHDARAEGRLMLLIRKRGA